MWRCFQSSEIFSNRMNQSDIKDLCLLLLRFTHQKSEGLSPMSINNESLDARQIFIFRLLNIEEKEMPEQNDCNNVSDQRSSQPSILSPAVAKGREQPLLTHRSWTELFITPMQYHTSCHECIQDGRP